MAYTATYASTDLDDVVVDLLVTVVVQLVAFGAILGLIIALRMIKGQPAVPKGWF
jgi:hypothetical protein